MKREIIFIDDRTLTAEEVDVTLAMTDEEYANINGKEYDNEQQTEKQE